MKLKKILCLLISMLMIISGTLVIGQALNTQTHTHYGGTANCIILARCTICDQYYGDYAPHTDKDGDNLCDICYKILLEPVVTETEETGMCGLNSRYTLNRQTGELVISGTGSAMAEPFRGRDDIKSVIIENGIEILQPNIFSGCKNLESVKIGDGITSISEYAFSDCESLKNVTFPSELRSIMSRAFSSCISLEEIDFPQRLDSIYDEAFSNCGFRKVVLPQKLYTFCSTALDYCENLVSVSFGEKTNVQKFYGGFFTGCYSLEEIIIPEENNYLSFENGILYNKNKSEILRYLCSNKNESLVLPDSVTSIYNMAFESQTHLKEITVPDSMKILPNEAFRDCYSLETVNLPDNLEKIGFAAFGYCKSLKSIVIPQNVTYIGGYAFHSCYSLEKIIIPENVTAIHGEAFNSCISLKEISLPDNLEDFFFKFSNCISLETIDLPACGIDCNGSIFQHCKSLKTINIPEECSSIKVNEDGVVFSKDGTELIYYPGGKQDKKYTIPSTVTTIHSSAFAANKYIEEIIVPDSVIYINYNAFGECSSLKTVRLSSNIEEIPDCLFSRDTNLKNIIIPEGVTRINENAFEYCVSLETIFIPSSVEYIDFTAFSQCFNLRTIINNSEAVTHYDKNELIARGHEYRSFKPPMPMTNEEVAEFFNNLIEIADSIYYNWIDDLDAYLEVLLENRAKGSEEYYLPYYEKMFGMKFESLEEVTEWSDNVYDAALSVELPDNTTVFCLPQSVEHEVCKEEGINHYFVDGTCDLECGIHSNVVSSNYYAPTCTENGYMGGKVCLTCLENAHTDEEEAAAILEAPEIIPATGHKAVTIKEVKPTCTENGLTEGVYCEKCHEVFTEQSIIPATGHSDNNSDGVCDICGQSADEEKPVTVFTQFINFVRNAFDRILNLFRKIFG